MPPVPWDLGLYPSQTDLWCEMLNSAADDYFYTKASAGTSFFLPSHTLHCTGNCKKIALETNKWKKPQCFLPWLDASSWQNGLRTEDFFHSLSLPYQRGLMTSSMHEWNQVWPSSLCPWPQAARCSLWHQARAEPSDRMLTLLSGGHCQKLFNLYALPYVCSKLPWPCQDTGRESQVMSLGLAHLWQLFKLSSCVRVDDIHSQQSFVNVHPSEGSEWSLLVYMGPVWSCYIWGLSTFHP